MKVKQMIEQLSKANPDHTVYIDEAGDEAYMHVMTPGIKVMSIVVSHPCVDCGNHTQCGECQNFSCFKEASDG